MEEIKQQLKDAEEILSKIWSKDSSREVTKVHSRHEKLTIAYWNDYYPSGPRIFYFYGTGRCNCSTITVFATDEIEARTLANNTQKTNGLPADVRLGETKVSKLKGEPELIYFDDGDT